VRNTVSAISSAIEKMAFLKSSKPIGSMPNYRCMSKDIYAALGVKRRINAGARWSTSGRILPAGWNACHDSRRSIGVGFSLRRRSL
jgi:hypothetical protein